MLIFKPLASSLERMEKLKKSNEDYLFGFQEFNREADDQFIFVISWCFVSMQK